MKPIYEEVTNELGTTLIKRTDIDGKIWWIPIDEFNADYQRYENPEAEQSTPILPITTDTTTEQTLKGEE
jgi:hypothetical protein